MMILVKKQEPLKNKDEIIRISLEALKTIRRKKAKAHHPNMEPGNKKGYNIF